MFSCTADFCTQHFRLQQTIQRATPTIWHSAVCRMGRFGWPNGPYGNAKRLSSFGHTGRISPKNEPALLPTLFQTSPSAAMPAQAAQGSMLLIILIRCSKLIAIKLCAISEMHAKVRRESLAGYATDETLACGQKEHKRWWRRY